MQHMNKNLRAAISRSLLQNRFAAEINAIFSSRKILAHAVLEEAMKPEEWEAFRKLPKFWFQIVNNVQVRIPHQDYGTQYLNFSGEIGNGEWWWHQDPPSVGIALPHHVLLMNHKLEGENLDRYEDETLAIGKLKDEIAKVTAQTNSALNRFSTVDKLITAWPEVQPYIPTKEVQKVNTLPAIPVSDLNRMLKLP